MSVTNTGLSSYLTNLALSSNLHTRVKQTELFRKCREFKFEYTGLGVELNGEFARLGPLSAPGAIIIPELIKVRMEGTGNFSVPIRFSKRTMVEGTFANGRMINGSWTRSTTTCTVTTTAPHGFSTNQHLNITNSSATTPVPNGGSGQIVVTSPTTFTFLCTNSGATSGSATFAETVSAQRPATWARSTTTLTFTTQGAHGYSSNQILDMTVMSDVAALAVGQTGVITVTGANTFTAVCTDAGAASGTATLGPACGNCVPVTSSVAFTQAAIYTGAGPILATATVTPVGLGRGPTWRKEDELIIEWGVITTVPPTTRKFVIEGVFSTEG